VGGLSKKIAGPAWLLLGLLAYAGFVAAYFSLVLHFLDGWIWHVFENNKTLYAIVALALICVQGILLQILTSARFRVIRREGK
jgi:hypothetical protein